MKELEEGEVQYLCDISKVDDREMITLLKTRKLSSGRVVIDKDAPILVASREDAKKILVKLQEILSK